MTDAIEQYLQLIAGKAIDGQTGEFGETAAVFQRVSDLEQHLCCVLEWKIGAVNFIPAQSTTEGGVHRLFQLHDALVRPDVYPIGQFRSCSPCQAWSPPRGLTEACSLSVAVRRIFAVEFAQYTWPL